MTTTTAKGTSATDTPPLAELRADAVEHLNGIKAELDEATKDIEALEKLGMDVTRLRERVDWGLKAREIILERFGKKP